MKKQVKKTSTFETKMTELTLMMAATEVAANIHHSKFPSFLGTHDNYTSVIKLQSITNR